MAVPCARYDSRRDRQRPVHRCQPRSAHDSLRRPVSPWMLTRCQSVGRPCSTPWRTRRSVSRSTPRRSPRRHRHSSRPRSKSSASECRTSQRSSPLRSQQQRRQHLQFHHRHRHLLHLRRSPQTPLRPKQPLQQLQRPLERRIQRQRPPANRNSGTGRQGRSETYRASLRALCALRSRARPIQSSQRSSS